MNSLNERLESAVGMDRGDCISEYWSCIADYPFERALHLGAGRDTHRISERISVSGSGRIVALDIDRTTLTEHGTCNRVVGQGQQLPFVDDSFDLVFSEYVFEHLEDPACVLAEIDRVVRPGGEVIILVPNPAHYYAKVATVTPFWFHILYLTLQGESDVKRDHYPTYHRWGRCEDLYDVADNWAIESIDSYPGPTAYTRWLPIHVGFVPWNTLSRKEKHHLVYLARLGSCRE